MTAWNGSALSGRVAFVVPILRRFLSQEKVFS